jgi:hypothetical protein
VLANNHHNDGHIAVWIPAPPGLQAMLIEASPETFFKPPYVGVRAGSVSSSIRSAMKIWHPTFWKPGGWWRRKNVKRFHHFLEPEK